MGDDPSTIGPGLAERVLDRLDLEASPSLDADGLADLYRRWCRSVTFDNVRKLIALNGGDTGPLPGLDATDFLETWLRHKVGGTCWPSANALHALAVACGFDSRRLAASMFDTGDPSHGTTVVTIDDTQWLIDSSMLTDEPVPLSTTDETDLAGPVFGTHVEPVVGGWLIDFPMPMPDVTIPCRTLGPGAVDHDLFAERYEISRTWSPFNEHVHARGNDERGMTSYLESKRYRSSPDGYEEIPLDNAELRAALIGHFGMSEEIVARLVEVLPGL
jgi:N-hydroxyarylamine O-acetyltransferase